MHIDYRRGAFFQRAGSPAGAQAGARTGNVRRQRERRRTGIGRLERNESTRNASGSSDEPPPQRATPRTPAAAPQTRPRTPLHTRRGPANPPGYTGAPSAASRTSASR